MLNENQFKKTICTLLTLKQVEITKQQNSALYSLIKNDFTDCEFESICINIAKTEKLYFRYPDPVLFYSRKKKETRMNAEAYKIVTERPTRLISNAPYIEDRDEETLKKISGLTKGIGDD